MSRNKFKLCLLILTSCILLFLFSNKAYSVYFATDKIILYENGKRIENSSVLHDADNGRPVCKNGICFVGQQFRDVIFYKTNENNLFNYDEWIDNSHMTNGQDGYQAYLKNIKVKAIYSIKAKLPPPEGGASGNCFMGHCSGGRIGNDRTLVLDLKKGTVSELANNKLSSYFSKIFCFFSKLFGKKCSL